MSEIVEATPADEAAAFAAMEAGTDQPGSEIPAKPETDAAESDAGELGSKETAQPVDPAKPEGKTVPIQALDAERDKRKAAQAAERLKDADLATARSRLDAIAKMQRTVMPDVDADPVAAMRAMTGMIEQHNNEQHTLNQARAVLAEASKYEAQYAEQVPEYKPAMDYLHRQVMHELMTFQGLTMEQATNAATIAAAQIQHQAMINGVNPAVPLMALAQSRGWRGEAQPAAPANGATPQPQTPAIPDVAQQAIVKAAQTLETIAAGQNAGRGGGMRGGADTPPSLREIAELSASDDPADIARVEAFWKGGGVRRAMG